MAGVVICHGSTVVRERLVLTAVGVPSLAPVRAAASLDELMSLARRNPPTIVLLDAHLPGPGPVAMFEVSRVLLLKLASMCRSQCPPRQTSGLSYWPARLPVHLGRPLG